MNIKLPGFRGDSLRYLSYGSLTALYATFLRYGHRYHFDCDRHFQARLAFYSDFQRLSAFRTHELLHIDYHPHAQAYSRIISRYFSLASSSPLTLRISRTFLWKSRSAFPCRRTSSAPTLIDYTQMLRCRCAWIQLIRFRSILSWASRLANKLAFSWVAPVIAVPIIPLLSGIDTDIVIYFLYSFLVIDFRMMQNKSIILCQSRVLAMHRIIVIFASNAIYSRKSIFNKRFQCFRFPRLSNDKAASLRLAAIQMVFYGFLSGSIAGCSRYLLSRAIVID